MIPTNAEVPGDVCRNILLHAEVLPSESEELMKALVEALREREASDRERAQGSASDGRLRCPFVAPNPLAPRCSTLVGSYQPTYGVTRTNPIIFGWPAIDGWQLETESGTLYKYRCRADQPPSA